MLTAEQVQARRHSIGGSDAAAAVGLSPYKTPYQLWEEKTGRAEPDDLSANDAVYFGNELEDIVARAFTRDTGKKVQRRNDLLVHKSYDFITANLDRIVVGEPAILECKTANQFYGMTEHWGDAGTDQVPEHYLLQCMHYLGVTVKEVAYLGALVGGQDYRTYTIERSDDLIKDLFEAEEAFWRKNVLEGIPPDPINEEDLLRKHGMPTKESDAEAVELIMDYCARLKAAKAEVKRIEADSQWLEIAIKDFMGPATRLKHGDDLLASWKRQITKRVSTTKLRDEMPEIAKQFTEASESRRFLLK